MATVLRNLVFAANARRPEQRGILSVREGDTVLLYDIDRRSLIGPFTAASDTYYSSIGPWAGRWDFLVNLEPASVKIGVLKGRELLELILGKGTLSIRDISALDTYWVHTLVLREADEIMKGFMSAAKFVKADELASAYGISGMSPIRVRGKPLTHVLKEELTGKKKVSEWVIEAATSLDTDLMKKLACTTSELVIANGIYLYMRKYLDVSAFSPRGEHAAIAEMKSHKDASEIVAAVEQVSYYAYSVSRGLRVPIENIVPAIIYYGGPGKDSDIADRLREAVRSAESTYGIRTDKFTVLHVSDVVIDDEKVRLEYEVIY